MTITPLFNPTNGKMRIAGLMSGSGSNLRKIIELEKRLGYVSPYRVQVIFTDNPNSNAKAIGAEHDIPVVTHDMAAFYAERGAPRRNLEVRAEYDAQTVATLRGYGVHAAAFAGYMSIATKPLIDAFVGVNVHPADLRILDGYGKRKYRGAHAVRDALRAGAVSLRSSTHLVSEEVDGGKILMISAPVTVMYDEAFVPEDDATLEHYATIYQNKLKEVGDWEIFPQTLLNLAQGRYALDAQGQLYYNGKPIPNGHTEGNI